jgi:hypothetical protein
MSAAKYHVGQTVWIATNRGRHEGVVEKVGRTLVHVRSGWSLDAYRQDTGAINDSYGHSHIWTADELAERDRRAAANKALRDRGIWFDYRTRQLSTETLEKFIALVDEADQ